MVTIIGLKAEDGLGGINSIGDYGLLLVCIEAVPGNVIGDKVEGCIVGVAEVFSTREAT